MKKLFLVVLIGMSTTLVAQDIFQQYLYSPEVVLKYRDEAGLSSEQVEKIKNIYNNELPAYNSKKWDLDAAMTALEKLISQNTVDAKAATSQLETSLALETEVKKMKLDILMRIKNTLTTSQQAKLDPHKGESIASSIIAPLNDSQRVELKIHGTEVASPLYIVIDRTGKTTEFDKSDAISDLNPNDIESLEVLKGEKALAAYGKRGANGVIIIRKK
jgi:TonB-dependent SusC/RagA subfamily outer membrane receptor